jgi:arsenate reductase
MAEGYLRKYLPHDQIYSAGVEAHGLNPLAVKVMSEDGIDISHHSSKPVESLEGISWDVVITVCDNARERCPFLPGKHQRMHQSFTDPADATGTDAEVIAVYRRVRDEIRDFALAFAKSQSQNR